MLSSGLERCAIYGKTGIRDESSAWKFNTLLTLVNGATSVHGPVRMLQVSTRIAAFV